ncbi:MAG: endonuclease domain-containing protein [Alphaproteobacteria bacterium]
MPRSDADWNSWFERREGNTKKTRGRIKPAGKLGAAATVARVIGESSFFTESWKRSKILDFADYRRENPTRAEAELRIILNQLGDGILRGKIKCEYVVSGKWIVDFYFPEPRLAIEVDGSIHLTGHQLKRDRLKDADCATFDITVLRITNAEVFGDREKLIKILRAGWRKSLMRKNKIIGLSEEEYFRRT